MLQLTLKMSFNDVVQLSSSIISSASVSLDFRALYKCCIIIIIFLIIF